MSINGTIHMCKLLRQQTCLKKYNSRLAYIDRPRIQMAAFQDVSVELEKENVDDVNLFSGKFRVSKKQVHVSLSSSKLVWNKAKNPSEQFSKFHVEVAICDVLAITHTERNSDKTSNEGVTVLDYIHHVNNDKKIMKRKTVKFSAHVDECQELSQKVNTLVASLKLRPRNLLVVVNPKSGSKSGKKIYRSVAPLFELSRIKTTVICNFSLITLASDPCRKLRFQRYSTVITKVFFSDTERMFHAKELLETYDLQLVDGIVIVSGDGMYWEVINAILLQRQRQAGVDPNDPEVEIKSCQIPIGMIPAGTGNGIALCRYGNKDPVSAALHVIIGKRLTAPACAVHNNGRLLTYCGILLGHGLFSDMIKASEENRWLGRARYLFFFPKVLMNRRLFHAEIEYLPAPGVEQLVKDAKGSNDNEVIHGISNNASEGWQKLSGDLYGVDCYPARFVPGQSIFTLYDISTMTLVAYSRCSATQQIKAFAKLSVGKVEMVQENFFHLFLVKACKVKLIKSPPGGTSADITYTDKELGLQVDGEFMKLETPEMHVRFFKDALQGFA